MTVCVSFDSTHGILFYVSKFTPATMLWSHLVGTFIGTVIMCTQLIQITTLSHAIILTGATCLYMMVFGIAVQIENTKLMQTELDRAGIVEPPE